MIRLLLAAVFIFGVHVAPAYAVTFDIWHTGMTRQDILQLAQNRNIPLAKGGMFNLSKRYDPKLLVGDATSYHYQTTLFNHSAKVQLRLSPAKGGYGQFLYEIDVIFTDSSKNKDLRPYVTRMLREKYGSPQVAPDLVRQVLLWKPEPNNEIRLTSFMVTMQVNYVDLKIKKFADELSKSTYELPGNPVDHSDSGKF